jgi:hypothetical protein
MAKGSRSIKLNISTGRQKRNSPSMHAPGDGSIRVPYGTPENVYGGDRSAQRFAGPMAPIGGPAKQESSRKRYIKE